MPLAGGDVTEGVVRVGDTVRRPVGPHSPLVHALLAHLESAGFEGDTARHAASRASGNPAPPAYPAELIGARGHHARERRLP